MADNPQKSEDLKEVPASEILAKIEKGDLVLYDSVIVKGDLKVKNLELQKDGENTIICSSIVIKNSIISNTIIFNNVIFEDSVIFSDTHFAEFANFEGSQFTKHTEFIRSIFNREAFFREVHFHDAAIFDGSQFGEITEFSNSKFHELISFQGCKFGGFANFGLAVFGYFADFRGVQFVGVNFWRSKFSAYANFSKAFFANTYFGESQFKGGLTFRNANFDSPSTQEFAFRMAKNAHEKSGNKEEAGYHFYREMEAIRRRNGFFFSEPDDFHKKSSQSLKAENWSIIKRILWYDFFEYVFIQLIFGYGVHPKRLMISWGVIVIAFGILYMIGNGIIGAKEWFDYFKVSFAIAIAPGYIAAIINPGNSNYGLIPEYQAVAMAETIVGTFLWAGFIATFAKKYMR